MSDQGVFRTSSSARIAHSAPSAATARLISRHFDQADVSPIHIPERMNHAAILQLPRFALYQMRTLSANPQEVH